MDPVLPVPDPEQGLPGQVIAAGESPEQIGNSTRTLGNLPRLTASKSSASLNLVQEPEQVPRGISHVLVLAASGLTCLLTAVTGPGGGALGWVLLALYLTLVCSSALMMALAHLLRRQIQVPPACVSLLHVLLVVLEAQWRNTRSLSSSAAWERGCLQLAVLQVSAMTRFPSLGWTVASVVVSFVLVVVMATLGQLSAVQIVESLLLPTSAMWVGSALLEETRLSWHQQIFTSFWQFLIGPDATKQAPLAEVLQVLTTARPKTKEALTGKLSSALAALKSSNIPSALRGSLWLIFKSLQGQVQGLVSDPAPLEGFMGTLEDVPEEVQNFVRDLYPGAPVAGSSMRRHVSAASESGLDSVLALPLAPRMPTPAPKMEAAGLRYADYLDSLLEPFLHVETVPALRLQQAFSAERRLAGAHGSWKLDMLAVGALCGNHPLRPVAELAMQPLLRDLKLDGAVVQAFFTSLEERYSSSNSYHNSIHAADVLHSMRFFLGLKSTPLQPLLPLERLAALTAAAAHDVGHDGRTNRFHTMAATPLAQLYNDQSCLEQLHCAITFALLQAEGANFGSALTPGQWQAFRSTVVLMILETDLGKHFQSMAAFKKDFVESTPESLDIPQQRQLLSFVLKACDVGASGKPFAVHAQWTTRINTEFYRQGDLEKELGLAPSPFCDRSVQNVADSQKGFYSFIVTPLFSSLNDYLRSCRVQQEILQEVAANQEFWQCYPSEEFNYEEPVESVPALLKMYEELRGIMPPAP